MSTFKRGQHVQTPLGPGLVVYQRMLPPDYNEPMVVSVLLDAKQNKPGYAGTTFWASDVYPLEEELRGFAGDQVTETQLWVDNTEPLYRMKLAIWQNLFRFCRKGTFNKDLAKKAFRYLTDAAARDYKRENGSVLGIADRREAEQDFVDEFVGASGCRPGSTFTSEMEGKVRREYSLNGCRCK